VRNQQGGRTLTLASRTLQPAPKPPPPKGLEEYAAPIIDAIDPTGSLIAHRLYRDATTWSDHYSCVKDLARTGRPPGRTVLVDDTPLAFLHQPANGVPVLGFRGDPDDRLLTEAVLPLLQALDGAPDVRPVLARRFNMRRWFVSHGYPPGPPAAAPPPSLALWPATAGAATESEAEEEEAWEEEEEAAGGAPPPPPAVRPQREVLVIADFEGAVAGFDAGSRAGRLQGCLCGWHRRP
jgi:hypothetical protein